MNPAVDTAGQLEYFQAAYERLTSRKAPGSAVHHNPRTGLLNAVLYRQPTTAALILSANHPDTNTCPENQKGPGETPGPDDTIPQKKLLPPDASRPAAKQAVSKRILGRL
ncbi:hypothetical protein GCM10019059_39870 [Camelimonas fluminis]|nr:hypothetical protein GCM10019059_39870 [Camelimonas fluminis]